MDIGIIGSGIAAQTLAGKLLELGHSVMISSRDTTQGKERPWGALPSADDFAAAQRDLGREAAAGGFADAAVHGEIVINATPGEISVAALESAGADHLAGKILIDVGNPLDYSRGMPPTLYFCNTDSLGERIQSAFPEARVVKTLNTVNAAVMVSPKLLAEPTALFVAGNDQKARDWVHHELLERWFEWEQVLDLGDITAARAVEMWLPLWALLFGVAGTPAFNIRVVAAT